MATEYHGSGGFRWALRDSDWETWKGLLDEIGRSSTPDGFHVIKENRKRRVLRGPHPGGKGNVVMKHYRRDGLLDRLATLFFPPPCEREWKMSALLAQRGVPTPRALALGTRRRGVGVAEGFFVTREVEFGRASDDESLWNRAFFHALGGFVRLLHDADVFHPDLHLGNILLGEGAGNFFVVDLHSLGPLIGLTPTQALENLSHIRNSLPLEAAHWFAPFLDGYFAPGDPPGLGRLDAAVAAQERAAAMHHRIARRLQDRCLRQSSSYAVTQRFGRSVFHPRHIAPDIVLLAFDAFFSSEHPLLKEDRSAVLRTGFRVDDRPVLIKLYRPCGITQFIRALFRRGRGRTAWRNGRGLVVRGIPCAEPLAYIRDAVPILAPREAVLLVHLRDSCELDRLLGEELDPSRRRCLAQECGRALGRVHSRNVYPHDLKACNVLVEETQEGFLFRLVDHDGASFPRTLSFKQKVRNLAQLNNSVPRALTRTDRLRFCIAYASSFANRPDPRRLFRAVWRRARDRGLVWLSPNGEDVFASWKDVIS